MSSHLRKRRMIMMSSIGRRRQGASDVAWGRAKMAVF